MVQFKCCECIVASSDQAVHIMRNMPTTFSATPPESLPRNHVSKRTQAVYLLVQNVAVSGLPHLNDETPLVGLIDLDLVDVLFNDLKAPDLLHLVRFWG